MLVSKLDIDQNNSLYYEYVESEKNTFTYVFVNALTGNTSAWNGVIGKELKAKGLLATCIQHEVDHLDGILFIDYLSKLKKDMIIKKLVKHKKEIERIVV